MSTPETKLPTVARVTHVEGIIIKEPAFKDLLGAKNIELKRRDGATVLYYRPSVEIAALIQDGGTDPIVLSKAAVLEHARKYFADRGGPAVPPSVVAPTPAPETPKTRSGVVSPDRAAQPGPAAVADFNLAIYTLLGAAVELGKSDTRAGAADRQSKLEAAFTAYKTQTTVN